jgi:hypothetical protein
MRRFVVVCYIRSEEAMKRICKLYRRVCRVIGPRKLTVSAWLWAREQEGSLHFWRAIVDDWFLIYRIEEDHCRKSFERETQARTR